MRQLDADPASSGLHLEQACAEPGQDFEASDYTRASRFRLDAATPELARSDVFPGHDTAAPIQDNHAGRGLRTNHLINDLARAARRRQSFRAR